VPTAHLPAAPLPAIPLRTPGFRRLALLLAAGALAALLASACTSAAQVNEDGVVYLPLVADEGLPFSANLRAEAARADARATAAALGDTSYNPPLEVTRLAAPPLVRVEDAPMPPIAPPMTGMLVGSRDPLAVFRPVDGNTTTQDAAPAQTSGLPLPSATPDAVKVFRGVLALEPVPAGVTPIAVTPDLPPPPPEMRVFATPDALALEPARNNPPLASSANGPPFDWSASENFLLLGTDRRPGENDWRTDSIMIVGLDRANLRAAVFSIPRDLYINIPDYGNGRINQADFIGELRSPGSGPELLKVILKDLLDVRIDHWVRIQMDGFVNMVDALGGLTVYLDCPFSELSFNSAEQTWQTFTLPAGENKMDGRTAYFFARLRYAESDIGRSRRQRALLWALRDQVLNTNLLPRLPELYMAFQETISTDLTLIDMIGLATTALELQPANVRAGGLTLGNLESYTTSNGAQVLLVTDQEYVRGLFNAVWDQPAMADAYRASAAGCTAPPTEVAAGEVAAGETLTGTPAVTVTTELTVSTGVTVPETAGEGDGS